MSRLDLVSVLDNTLRDLPPNQSTSSIFKVPSRLRRVNERAFEPEILSIGPYHRGKDNLKTMEEHKKRYLQKLLHRRRESSVGRYVAAMRRVEGKARQFYDQSVILDEDRFVEMLLLDGCFIVELIRKMTFPEIRGNDDHIIEATWILSCITADMLLLENQLPFFVLRELFTMTAEMRNEDFFSMTLHFFKWIAPGSEFDSVHRNDEYKHLLDVVYHHWYQLPSPATTATPATEERKELDFIRTAKELKEAGIKFKKQEESTWLFDVKCSENGTIKIPCLKIYDTTESLFRNLVAYEQCSQFKHLYVTDYITLMDCLINTQEDVQILRHSGIIKNGLGDDGMVSSLFNKLATNVMVSHRHDFYYAQEFDSMNEHCMRRRNVWMAKLKRNYFNSPWALLSFLAALALLLFTLVQTVFTIMSYFKRD